jgi:hypothetical protein
MNVVLPWVINMPILIQDTLTFTSMLTVYYYYSEFGEVKNS